MDTRDIDEIITEYENTLPRETPSDDIDAVMESLDNIVAEVHQEIPVNSKTLTINERTSRFSSAVWYEEIQKKTIILAGLGGIGSYINFLLARMNPASMFIYDNDAVEAVNMSGQLYGNSHIGKFKAEASVEVAGEFANYHSVFAVHEKYTAECNATDIMICGFDNMAARSTFFHSWYNHVQGLHEDDRYRCLYIDGRIKC